MSNYIVNAGDTFSSIARRQYGSEKHAGLIARSNPGIAEPLVAGSTLIIPARPGAPSDRASTAPAGNPDEVGIFIDGKHFKYWQELQVVRSVDCVSSVIFTAPFDADAANFRETFAPLSFKSIVVTVGGSPLFTGILIDVDPSVSESGKTVTVTAYATPGVLSDCTAPPSLYPELEYEGQTLPEIARTLSTPFGIDIVYNGVPGAAFEWVAIEPTDTIMAFLTKLAAQRSRVITDTPSGGLLFQQSAAAGSPVAKLIQGEPPLLSVEPRFNPQQYYSHVTGLESSDVGTDGSQYTIRNSLLAGVLRPHTFVSSDVTNGDIPTATAAKMGRMYANAASYTAAVNTWRTKSGVLWTPNSTVVVQAPDAMIYSEYEFLIRSVRYLRTDTKTQAILELVMPGAFQGEIPETLPWQ